MKYQVEENCLTIFLPGELDHHNAEEIRKGADKLIEENHIKCVIFDFQETNFMDSSGIAVLLRAYRRLGELGGAVKVVHVPAQAGKVLRAAGLDKLMEFE